MEILLAIFAIIGGIVGFFKDQSDKRKDYKPNKVPRPKPTSTPSGPAKSFRQESTMASIEERKKEQLERLAGQLQTNGKKKNDSHEAFDHHSISKHSSSDFKQKARMKQQVESNLTGKGLVNGIIMAEILGPPRARKPHRNVISERER